MSNKTFGRFASTKKGAESDKKLHDASAAAASRAKYEPDPQRIVAQVMAEIPFGDNRHARGDRSEIERYARIIAIECMRRQKEKL